MSGGQRVDWRAIPRRFERWQGRPLWRKLLWLVHRGVLMTVLYVAFAVGILWYNEPTVVSAVLARETAPWALLGLFAAQPALLVICLLLIPAVLAAVLLPHRPDWS